MNRNSLLLCLMILSVGCLNSAKRDTLTRDSVVEGEIVTKPAKKDDAAQQKVGHAKEWLLLSIKRFFKAELGQENDTTIFTKQYLAYKQDAISRDFDGLTEKQFTDKWKSKYDTKFATTNSILIGQQDTVNPKVTSCQLKSQNADGSLVFHVTLEDRDADNKYVHLRDIKLIPSGSAFLIDDILEYD